MQEDGLRALAVVLFAAAAILAGLGNERHAEWLVGIAFGCFAAGALAFLRWRSANQHRVFASEEKTCFTGSEGTASEAEEDVPKEQ